jgi:hypothetical protein
MAPFRCESCGRTWREAGALPAPTSCPLCDRDALVELAAPRRRRPRFRSPRAFYSADRRRLTARERDFGLRWRDSETEPVRRLAWIEDTGELYLVESGDTAEGGGPVEVLAVVPERRRVERALRGWERVCGKSGSLRWLRERIRGLRLGPEPAPT